MNAKARQSYEAFLLQRAETRENEQGEEQTEGPETVLTDQTPPYNVSNEGNEGIPLAQGNGSGIMGEGAQGENAGGAWDAGKKRKAEDSGKVIVDIPFDEIGKLMPNVIYKSGEFSYDYETDSLGRIERFSTSDLHLTTRTGRLPHDQDTPGKLPSDHAGHLAGDRFGGSSELENLVSQSSDVNLSQYKRIENQWAKAIDAGKKVRVHVDIEYDNSNMRPAIFNVNYMIDDEIFTKTLIN